MSGATPTGAIGGNAVFKDQTPFPLEWTDSQLTTARSPTIADIHHHVLPFLADEAETPLKEAPFDVNGDWEPLEDEAVEIAFLRFLSNKKGKGLGLSPTAIYLMFTRACITTCSDLYQFLKPLPTIDLDNSTLAHTIVRELGTQMCFAHASEIARVVVLKTYANQLQKSKKGKLITVNASSETCVFHYSRFKWKNMARNCNQQIRLVTQALATAAHKQA